MTDPLQPDVGLLCKLGSLVAHTKCSGWRLCRCLDKDWCPDCIEWNKAGTEQRPKAKHNG